MKRIFWMLFWSFFALSGMQAQAILNNSKWFDGTTLYRATVTGNTVVLNGNSVYEKNVRLTLRKTEGPRGEYELASSDDDCLRVRGQQGWEVSCVNNQGMQLLAVRNQDGATVWTMVKTVDNLEDCLGQEQWAENQPTTSLTNSFLMNTAYLSHLGSEEIMQLKQKIEVEHRNSYPLSTIETFNLSLLQSELDFRRELSNEDYDDDYEPTEGAPVGNEILVTNEVEFLGALWSGTTVVVKAGVTLNLSRVLQNKDMFHTFGRLALGAYESKNYVVEGRSLAYEDGLVASEDIYDGPQLSLINMKDLTIRGESGAKIVVEPRYAFVFNLVGCENVVIENLTIGHTEGGYCEGGVIGVERSSDVYIRQCDLYGCGTYGLVAERSRMIRMSDSNIHDCTYGIMELQASRDVTFTRCDFFRNREFDLVGCIGCNNVTFSDCRFYANDSDASLFGLNQHIVLDGCEVWHPADKLGNVDYIMENGKATKWVSKGTDKMLKSRGCGPK